MYTSQQKNRNAVQVLLLERGLKIQKKTDNLVKTHEDVSKGVELEALESPIFGQCQSVKISV